MSSAIVATAILDPFIERPAGGGSVTTLVPGFVYGAATVMKVCVVAGLGSAVIAFIARFLDRAPSEAASAAVEPRLPGWAIASIALAPVTPLGGAIAVMIAQLLAPTALTLQDFTYVSRSAVFVTLALLSAGVIAALLSLTRRERPRQLAMLGLLVNSLLIALFWRLEFFAIGFDQDTWAPR
jgi:hypothetical protein